MNSSLVMFHNNLNPSSILPFRSANYYSSIIEPTFYIRSLRLQILEAKLFGVKSVKQLEENVQALRVLEK